MAETARASSLNLLLTVLAVAFGLVGCSTTKPAAKKTKVGGSIAVPVEFGGLLMGTLGVGKLEPYDFTSAEISDLQTVAAEIAEKWADG